MGGLKQRMKLGPDDLNSIQTADSWALELIVMKGPWWSNQEMLSICKLWRYSSRNFSSAVFLDFYGLISFWLRTDAALGHPVLLIQNDKSKVCSVLPYLQETGLVLEQLWVSGFFFLWILPYLRVTLNQTRYRICPYMDWTCLDDHKTTLMRYSVHFASSPFVGHLGYCSYFKQERTETTGYKQLKLKAAW